LDFDVDAYLNPNKSANSNHVGCASAVMSTRNKYWLKGLLGWVASEYCLASNLKARSWQEVPVGSLNYPLFVGKLPFGNLAPMSLLGRCHSMAIDE